MMRKYKYEAIQVELPYEIISIQNITLKAALNEHYYLTLDALIDEQWVEQYLNESIINKQVTVIIQQKIIYIGRIHELKIESRGLVNMLHIASVSYSADLDVKKNDTAFVNLQQTYEDVINAIANRYPNAAYMDHITEGKKLSHLLVQYKETDWSFIKRIASHFETVLVVNASAPISRVHFGLEPIYKQKNLEEAFNEREIDFETFQKLEVITEKALNVETFIGWRVLSRMYFSIGTVIYYEGKQMYITSLELESKQGEIAFQYELKLPQAILGPYQINHQLKGVSIEAIVKRRRNNEMQLHFCINDTYEPAEGNQWFEYAREVGNFYCMPIEESKVHVTFTSGDEKHTVVTHAIRTASPGSKYFSKAINPDYKSYSTVHGQELLLTPELLQIAEDEQKTIQFTLNKDGNVNITAKTIQIHGNNCLKIGTQEPYDEKENPVKPKQIKLSAKNKLVVTKSIGNDINLNHSIELVEQSHLKGKVKLQK